MSEPPRWERESHEDLSAPGHQPQDTVEMDRLLDHDELRDPAEFAGSATADEAPDRAEGRVGPRSAGVVLGAAARRRRTTVRAADGPRPETQDGDGDPGAEPAGPFLAGARDALAVRRLQVSRRLAASGASARESVAGARDALRDVRTPDVPGGLSAVRESLRGGRAGLAETAGSMRAAATRAGRLVASLDRRPEFDAVTRRDPVAELTMPAPSEPAEGPQLSPSSAGLSPESVPAGEETSPERFPLAVCGYDRARVDHRLAELESELERLRRRTGPVSISEEIERLGEQTASILITAHDTAHETARRAQEQAARAVTDAADDAERITLEAERRLRELDRETDAVWRERERLLADVREVSATLATLADAAVERFPGELAATE